MERHTANVNKKQIMLEQKCSFCLVVRDMRFSLNVECNPFVGGIFITVHKTQFCIFFSLSLSRY